MKRRIIFGFFVGLFGFLLMGIPLFIEGKDTFFSWAHGLPIFVIGLVIMFNKKEDQIEQINFKEVKNE